MLLGHLYNAFKKEDDHTNVDIMADVYFRRKLKMYRVRVRTQYEIKTLDLKAIDTILNDFKVTCKNVAENFNVKTDTRLEYISYGQGRMIIAERVRLRELLKILT